MVYSRYVYGCGPYFYESKRDGNHVHSIYRGKSYYGKSGDIYTTSSSNEANASITNKTDKDLNSKTDISKTEEDKMIDEKIGTTQQFIAEGAWGKNELQEDFYVRSHRFMDNPKLVEKYGSRHYVVEVEKTSIETDSNGKVTKSRPDMQRIGSFYKTYDEAKAKANEVMKK